ncbi:Os12g0237950 [Oryza sativa Japonica Group]|uniref:Os12g0237950 protein n=3 Tax=Oryza TaxID=4527 RepID=Q2QV97_ORYSJ|nr:hypothetical protein LOC_Os12g13560 [Oryza sativa Japonica Group]BAT16483.1 Os12g0237950 [Oryza sativa Japonica Group]
MAAAGAHRAPRNAAVVLLMASVGEAGLIAVATIGVNTEGEGGRVGSLVTSSLLLPAALLIVVIVRVDAEREGWCIRSLITLMFLPSIAAVGEVGFVTVALEIDFKREG